MKAAGKSSFPWSEALSFAGINASGLVLVQLDRLVIPHVLPLHDLATFGVLAAIAGSLFRVLSMGVGYSLVPRLRAAKTVLDRRHLVAHEAKLVSAIAVGGSVAIWVSHSVDRAILSGRQIPSERLSLVGGLVKRRGEDHEFLHQVDCHRVGNPGGTLRCQPFRMGLSRPGDRCGRFRRSVGFGRRDLRGGSRMAGEGPHRVLSHTSLPEIARGNSSSPS